MAAAAKAQPFFNEMHRQIGLHQKALRFADSAVNHILHGGQTGFPLEKVRQRLRCSLCICLAILSSGQEFGIMTIQIFCDLPHQCLVFLFDLVSVIFVMQRKHLFHHQQDTDCQLPQVSELWEDAM